MKRTDVLRLSISFLLSGLLLTLSINWLEQSRVALDKQSPLVEAPPLAHLPLAAIDFITLGHRHLYDDLTYLWLLQKLLPGGDHQGASALATEQLTTTIHLALQHKPRIEAIYLLSCFVLAMERHAAALCEPLLGDALSLFPSSWRLLMTAAYLYAFPLNQPLKAAAYYHLAATQKRSPPYVRRLAYKMLAKGAWSPAEEEEVLALILSLPGAASFKNLLQQGVRPSQEPQPAER